MRRHELRNHPEPAADLDTKVTRLYPELKRSFEQLLGITFTPIEAVSLRRHMKDILTEHVALSRNNTATDAGSLFHAELLARFLLDYGIHFAQYPSRGVPNIFRDHAFQQYFKAKRAEDPTHNPPTP